MIVLDTHALVWLTQGRAELGKEARELAARALAEDSLGVSAISFWEIAMLEHKGRLHLQQPLGALRGEVLGLGIGEVAVTGDIGIAAANLEDFHADPADRLIVATASLTRSTLMTADHRILEWPGTLLRHNART
jgi:PIN domain nuclease of toxin-antitoxin system